MTTEFTTYFFFKYSQHNEYIGPALGAEQLVEKLKEFGYGKDASILDLGCGTGAAGVRLQNLGYKNIDGADLSSEMLKEAEKKGVYRYSVYFNTNIQCSYTTILQANNSSI